MTPAEAGAIVEALPMPVVLIGADRRIEALNAAAEAFFGTSTAVLRRLPVADLFPPGSPVIGLIETAAAAGASVSEHDLTIAAIGGGEERRADIHVGPAGEDRRGMVLVLNERTIAEKLGRQLTHRTAARSVSALSAILAHEIKNPLSGIRGAAQLLESSVNEDDRLLTSLIRDETDRIVRLVDRMEMFSDVRPLVGEPLNIHVVLDHVKRLARSGFARGVSFVEHYDPSLPPVHGDRDQLVQVFLNLVKNAAEAIGAAGEGEIMLSTAFRPGLRVATANSRDRVGLPLEIGVRDNGPGVPADVLSRLFDPFVTTKANGTGLGLALVAKIIGDHGGTITCDSAPRRTTFLVNLPMVTARARAATQ